MAINGYSDAVKGLQSDTISAKDWWMPTFYRQSSKSFQSTYPLFSLHELKSSRGSEQSSIGSTQLSLWIKQFEYRGRA